MDACGITSGRKAAEARRTTGCHCPQRRSRCSASRERSPSARRRVPPRRGLARCSRGRSGSGSVSRGSVRHRVELSDFRDRRSWLRDPALWRLRDGAHPRGWPSCLGTRASLPIVYTLGLARGDCAPLRTPGLSRRCGSTGRPGAQPPDPRTRARTAQRRTVVVRTNVEGRQLNLGLGSWPDISLAEAHEECDGASRSFRSRRGHPGHAPETRPRRDGRTRSRRTIGRTNGLLRPTSPSREVFANEQHPPDRTLLRCRIPRDAWGIDVRRLR